MPDPKSTSIYSLKICLCLVFCLFIFSKTFSSKLKQQAHSPDSFLHLDAKSCL